jgi:hypothetical protein
MKRQSTQSNQSNPNANALMMRADYIAAIRRAGIAKKRPSTSILLSTGVT